MSADRPRPLSSDAEFTSDFEKEARGCVDMAVALTTVAFPSERATSSELRAVSTALQSLKASICFVPIAGAHALAAAIESLALAVEASPEKRSPHADKAISRGLSLIRRSLDRLEGAESLKLAADEALALAQDRNDDDDLDEMDSVTRAVSRALCRPPPSEPNDAQAEPTVALPLELVERISEVLSDLLAARSAKSVGSTSGD